jgi:CRISPR-associated protein Csb1
VDSVGSQANRIEPLFLEPDYRGLVPQIVVKAGNNLVNLLEAGHRAGDAIVRCSSLKQELQDAFKAVLKGNAEPLAKIGPTSLVFGVWDSRDTQAKLPRLISSTIRAFDVTELKRSAVYEPPLDHIREGNIPDYDGDAEKKKYSQRGWLHALASASHGGVIASGDIRRDATLSLAALRLLRAGDDDDKTQKVRRYILGLGLTAFTHTSIGYLRQGCQLVLNPQKPREFVLVNNDGMRLQATLSHADALVFAKEAAKDFGIDPDREIKFGQGPDREVLFDTELAKKDVTGDESSKAGKTKGSKK